MKHAAPEPAGRWLRRRSVTVAPEPEPVDVSARLNYRPAEPAAPEQPSASEPLAPEPVAPPRPPGMAAMTVWWDHPAATVVAAAHDTSTGTSQAASSDESAQDDTEVDLRDEPVELPDDPHSVLVRLARLRDAGLLTPAEYEDERRALLHGSVG